MSNTALAAVIASTVAITLGGTTALAFGHSGQNGYQNSVAGTTDMVYNQNSNCEYCEEYGRHYTDANNDGICDYYDGSGYHRSSSAYCDGTGHHAGRGYSRR